MIKYILFTTMGIFLRSVAQCQSADTLIAFYKQNAPGINARVETRDSADFIRIITPPDSGDDKHNVREYYKSGKIRFIGKVDPRLNYNFDIMGIKLTGDCIFFYETGKRQNIVKYDKGVKIGLEYVFYPNGTPYFVIKHGSLFFIENSIWECYDIKGNEICKDGNGQCIEYDNDFKNITFSGPVKKGLKTGTWFGTSISPDSIKYTATFDRGNLVSGLGYDKAGIAYPYKKVLEKADFKQGPIVFIERLRNHLTVPRKPDGKKMSLDDVVISFVVEKDGSLTNIAILGDAAPELQKTLLAGFATFKEWQPSRYYGIPLRTQILLPMKFLSGYSGNSYSEHMFYQEKSLGF